VSAPTVAVIDIGSNSIKVLIAARAADGGIDPVFWESLDARISAGISAASPRLSAEGMARGVAAVRELLALAAHYAPVRTVLVATSAVRDASNGEEFCQQVAAVSGLAVRILTGDEEANLIGRGLTADPALAHLRDFHVFDLGGGSLECLTFHDRHIQRAASLQLGCVRLTEMFVPDSATAFTAGGAAAIQAHTKAELRRGGIDFAESRVAVGTGGTVATVRKILGARRGVKMEDTAAVVTVPQLQELFADLAALPLAERRNVAGLPAGRADVFPTALATILAVAEVGGFTEFHHSVYNLRYGLAADLLAEL
jgi:exopolyphosphatase/guanosine-5'-triphosphate,3'-diphosphate pyrophosphatase